MEDRMNGEVLNADSMVSILEMAEDLNHSRLAGATTIEELEGALSED